MSLDLTIQGDVEGIKAVSEWLSGTLAATADKSDVELSLLVSDASHWWTGESGAAFNSTAQAARRTTFSVPTFVKDLAEVMRAYAERLQRGQTFFDEVKDYAREGGLTVTANVVKAPEPGILYCPGPDAPAEDHAAYDDYLGRLELYNRLGQDVGTWEGQLELWVLERFGGLFEQLNGIAEAAAVLQGLIEHNKELVEGVFAYAAARTNRDLATWRTTASQHLDDYETYKQNKRSGHPGRRAAAERAVPQDLRVARRQAFDNVSRLSSTARIIPGIGYVAAAGIGAYELSQGSSPTSFVIESLAGAGGAAVGGALVSGGPVVWVAGAVVVGSVAAGTGAKWLWESAVPLHIRETLDNNARTNTSRNWIFWDDSPRIPR